MAELPVVTYLTASGLITNKPAEIIALLVRSSGAGAGVATIYDGENATTGVKTDLSAVANDSKGFTPAEPIICTKGIYVALSANVASFTILYRHL